MSLSATIHLKLAHSGSKEWVDFASEKVERDRCEWSFSGQYFDCLSEYRLRNISLHCALIGAKKTTIWSRGRLYGTRIVRVRNYRLNQLILLDAFDFRNTISEFNLREWGPDVFTDAEKQFFDLELGFKRNYSTFADDPEVSLDPDRNLIELSDPNNRMIESAADAVPVDVDGERLWLSKSKLTAKSPFFNAFFNSDFLEKCTGKYELKEIELNVFLHFVSIIYELDVAIHGDSVESLLKMADYFQCEQVKDRCEEFLKCDEKEVSFERKVILADCYKLSTSLFKDMVWAMLGGEETREELQKFVDKNADNGLYESTVTYVKEQLEKESEEEDWYEEENTHDYYSSDDVIDWAYYD